MATEKRLIDAIELANFFGFMRKMWSGSEIMNVIHEAETVDAVEVVRCKDCKYYRKPFCLIHDNKHGWLNHELPEHFCSHGERQSDG